MKKLFAEIVQSGTWQSGEAELPADTAAVTVLDQMPEISTEPPLSIALGDGAVTFTFLRPARGFTMRLAALERLVKRLKCWSPTGPEGKKLDFMWKETP